MFNFESQDLAALGSLGVSAYVFHQQVRHKGLSYSSLFDSYRRPSRFNFNGRSQSSDLFLGMREEAFMQQKLLEAGRATTFNNLMGQGLEGMEEAARMGILETLSRPRLQGRLGPGQYESTFNNIRNADAATLQREIRRLIDVNQNIPEFESTLLSSIKGRITSKYKGQSYQSMLHSMAQDYTLDRVSGLDIRKPNRTIASRNEAVNLFGGQKGYWDKFESLVGKLERNKIVEPGAISRLFKDGRVFETPDGSAYARLKTNAGELNVPLKRNTIGSPIGDVPVYHSDVRGNTRYSFIQNFFKAGENGRLATNAQGKLIRMGFEDAMFFSDDAVIFNAIEEAQGTGKSIMSILGGVGDFKADETLRYGEYFLDDASGLMVPMGRQSQAAVLGYHNMVKDRNTMDVMETIERQLKGEGIDAFAASSPGSVGKLGSFHILEANGPPSLLGLYARPRSMSGARRPMQGLTRTWSTTNINELTNARAFGEIGKDEFQRNTYVFNPVQHPLLKNELYRKMLRDPSVGKYMMPAGVSHNTLWSFDSNVLG